jgi:hypothetical protein
VRFLLATIAEIEKRLEPFDGPKTPQNSSPPPSGALADQPQVFMDESPTKERPARAWLWSAVARTFAVFSEHAGMIARRTFCRRMGPVRHAVDGLLLRGTYSEMPGWLACAPSCTTIGIGSGHLSIKTISSQPTTRLNVPCGMRSSGEHSASAPKVTGECRSSIGLSPTRLEGRRAAAATALQRQAARAWTAKLDRSALPARIEWEGSSRPSCPRESSRSSR